MKRSSSDLELLVQETAPPTRGVHIFYAFSFSRTKSVSHYRAAVVAVYTRCTAATCLAVGLEVDHQGAKA